MPPESASVTAPLSGTGPQFLEFRTGRHLCTLGTVRPDGTPHVVPVGATPDSASGTARVISSATSHKVRRILAAGAGGAAVSVCQVDGRRWSTPEGRAVVRDGPEEVADAEQRYAQRYRTPRENPRRVVTEITVTRKPGRP